MKPGIRVLGIDDSSFNHSDEETFLTGVVYRGTEFIEDIRSTRVTVDGEDATEKTVEVFEKCNNLGQIKAVLTDGVSFAGFNIVDIREVSERTGKPVIAVTSNRPDRGKFREAMKKSGNYDERFEEMGGFEVVEMGAGETFFQYAGCSRDKAANILRKSTLHGLTPEPIRVAHMIGRAFEGSE